MKLMTADVSQARAFALAAHADQRYGEHPYAYHLDAVAALLAPYGAEAQVIGYLHDVVEDTSVPTNEIRSQFGDLAASCVALVTDVPGANREERKVLTNSKLAAVTGSQELALIVKAADRLANLQMSASSESGSKLEMYRLEHEAFRRAAYRPGLCEGLWQEMNLILKID
jgi:(p)ppGpp synthase/HD superfamily hydrolase